MHMKITKVGDPEPLCVVTLLVITLLNILYSFETRTVNVNLLTKGEDPRSSWRVCMGDSPKLGSEPIWIARVPKEYVYIVMVETREEKHIRRGEKENTFD
jgi:hypothetical protein